MSSENIPRCLPVNISMGIKDMILTMSVKKIESNLTRWRPETVKNF